MSYITNGDIEDRLGTSVYLQLADDDNNGTADSAVVDEARLGAEGEMDSYLARRFTLPIDLGAHAELGGILASIALDLAEYRLRCRRPPISAEAIRRRDEAIAWLSGVAERTIELPAFSEVAAASTGGLVARVSGRSRVLTDDELSAL